MHWHNDYDKDNYLHRQSTEIYDLRREGKLDEAKQRAEEILREDNTDTDVWKAYAWTLVDICKREQEQGNIDNARQIVDYLSKLYFDTRNDRFAGTLVRKIQQLRLSVNPYFTQIQEAKELSQNGNNDRAWEILTQLAAAGNLPVEAHESYGWTIYRYLKEHVSSLTSVQVRTQLRDYINLTNERPSNLHTQILSFALNYSKQDEKFKLIAFLRLWGPRYLRNDDFDDSQDSDGHSIPSLMSRIARAIVNYPTAEIQDIIDLLPLRKDDFIEMLREHFFWKIYRSSENGVTSSTWDCFEQYLTFFATAPSSIWHSKVLSWADRVMKENNAYRFYDFFKRWDPDKLRAADWREEKGDNGEKYKPLAIKSLKKAREALETLSDDQIGDLQWLIDLYGIAVDKFPDDDWNIRSKALLHLRAGQLPEARSIYKELCLKMGEKYYIWQEYADCWMEPNIKISLLCKALSLEKNEDFLGKIRLELARQLIKAKRFENAVVELDLYKKHYTKMGWRIDTDVDGLLEQCSSTTPAQDKNASLYAECIPDAEERAYSDIPYTNLVLVDKWKNDDGKEMMTFVDGDSIEFTTNRKRFPILRDSHLGQVWMVKLYKDETERIVSNEYSWRPPKKEKIIKYVPLVISTSDVNDWLSLPIKYGIVQHVNTEKKAYHIYSTESVLSYEHYKTQSLNKGDFVTFRQYKKKVKEETKVFFCDIRKCDPVEGLQQFECRTVVVDDVNTQKQLFHFVLGLYQLSGILRFDQTELRPSVGDCIVIHYYERKIDDKKNPGHQKRVIEVIKAEATDEINSELVKTIYGLLELKYRSGWARGKPDFAFIDDDYYVHQSLLDKYKIHSDCYVEAKAVLTGDGKWRVYEILSIDYDVEE